MGEWTKASWRGFPAAQQPKWPSDEGFDNAVETISALPPLVFAGEIRELKRQLADAADGKAFLLQGGDCAEDFSRCTADSIRDTLKVLLQMAVVLTYAGGKPVIKVGRLAGQYAKPRSSDTEHVNGLVLPSYRGDMVNSHEPDDAARVPDPERMVQRYFQAAATLNLTRAFTRGGYAALRRVNAWNNEFVASTPMGQSYAALARNIDHALEFMHNIGFDTEAPQLSEVSMCVSHEALLLGYEEAMTRQDSITGKWYDCSAHMVWIGDRTRQPDGAHVEFLRGVRNPLGLKIGPTHDFDEINRVMETLNPDNEPGRLTLVTRFGADDIGDHLPTLIRKVSAEGRKVVWCCDPMHGNSTVAATGHKTRSFDDILREIRAFFEIHRAEGTVPGGIHFELTGDNVTECTGGGRNIVDAQLLDNYQTRCDPRLNAEQSLETAFQIAELLRG